MRKEAGVTLTEVAVVIAVIGVLTTIAIPNWLSWRANAKINGALTNLRGDIEMVAGKTTFPIRPAAAMTKGLRFNGRCRPSSMGTVTLADTRG